jgi:membrane protein DedA with SNARE-associated domain
MSLEGLTWTTSIFLWLFFTGIGIPPVPEEAGILYAASVAAVRDDVPWWVAWPAAGLGITGADLVLYGAGYWLGPRVFEYRLVQRVFSAERRQRLEGHFRAHGVKFLLMARLLPPLRTGVFLMAGSIRYSLTRFLVADIAYAVVGVGLVFFGGTAFVAVAHRYGGWLLLLAALVVGGYFLLRYYRYLRKLELKATAQVLEAAAPEVLAEEAAPPAASR